MHVRRRPHLARFLQRCAELFEVVVFTASQKVYAEQLLNILDPTRCASPAACMHDRLGSRVQHTGLGCTCTQTAGSMHGFFWYSGSM